MKRCLLPVMEAAAPSLCSPVVIQVYCLFSERLFCNTSNQEEGELVSTQGIYNATKKIVTVSQANHCIKVFSVFPLKDK